VSESTSPQLALIQHLYGEEDKLSDEERKRIKGLAEGGFSGREIARRVRRSPQGVANVLSKDVEK
ncbi:hypothetical protein F444_07554, partial [Phytophthora nicotianae P1976]